MDRDFDVFPGSGHGGEGIQFGSAEDFPEDPPSASLPSWQDRIDPKFGDYKEIIAARERIGRIESCLRGLFTIPENQRDKTENGDIKALLTEVGDLDEVVVALNSNFQNVPPKSPVLESLSHIQQSIERITSIVVSKNVID